MVRKHLSDFLNRLWRCIWLRGIHFRKGTGSSIKLWKVKGTPQARVDIGSNSQIETRIIMERAAAQIQIGSRSFLGGGWISCASKVTIGDDVLVSWEVAIFDHGSHALTFSDRSGDVVGWRNGEKDWSVVHIAPVCIENKAWIGFRSIILPGVTIGEGAIVGSGSVVTRNVAPWTIVAGNPARLIRELPTHER